jgi:hypothetical protein
LVESLAECCEKTERNRPLSFLDNLFAFNALRKQYAATKHVEEGGVSAAAMFRWLKQEKIRVGSKDSPPIRTVQLWTALLESDALNVLRDVAAMDDVAPVYSYCVFEYLCARVQPERWRDFILHVRDAAGEKVGAWKAYAEEQGWTLVSRWVCFLSSRNNLRMRLALSARFRDAGLRQAPMRRRCMAATEPTSLKMICNRQQSGGGRGLRKQLAQSRPPYSRPACSHLAIWIWTALFFVCRGPLTACLYRRPANLRKVSESAAVHTLSWFNPFRQHHICSSQVCLRQEGILGRNIS